MTSEVDIYRSRHTGKEIDDAVDRVAQLINELDSLGGSWVEVVQTTGFSTSKVMSQAAVTRLLDTLAKLYDPKQGITAGVLKAVKTFMLENQDNGQENAILHVKNTEGGGRELRIATGDDTLIIPLKSGHVPLAEEVQPLLVSGQNIKTVNGQSLLGDGDLDIKGGGGGDVVITLSPTTLVFNEVGDVALVSFRAYRNGRLFSPSAEEGCEQPVFLMDDPNFSKRFTVHFAPPMPNDQSQRFKVTLKDATPYRGFYQYKVMVYGKAYITQVLVVIGANAAPADTVSVTAESAARLGAGVFAAQGARINITEPIALKEGTEYPVGRGSALHFFAKGRIDGPGTLALDNTLIEAPMVKVFGDTLRVKGLMRCPAVYPEWFGAAGDGVADDAPAIQRAIDCAGHVPVTLAAERYLVKSTLNMIEPLGNPDILAAYGYTHASGSAWNVRQTLTVMHDIIGDASLAGPVIRMGSRDSHLTVRGAVVVRNPTEQAVGVTCVGTQYDNAIPTSGPGNINTGDLGCLSYIDIASVIKGADGFSYFDGGAQAAQAYGLGKGSGVVFASTTGGYCNVRNVYGFHNGVLITFANGCKVDVGAAGCVNAILIDGLPHAWAGGVTRNEIRLGTVDVNASWAWVKESADPSCAVKIGATNAVTGSTGVEVADNRITIDGSNTGNAYNTMHLFHKRGPNNFRGNIITASSTLVRNQGAGWMPLMVEPPDNKPGANNANRYVSLVAWDYKYMSMSRGYNTEVSPVVIDPSPHTVCYRYGNLPRDTSRFYCEKVIITAPEAPEMHADPAGDSIRILVPHYSQLHKCHVLELIPGPAVAGDATVKGHIYIQKAPSGLPGVPKHEVWGWEDGAFKRLGYYIDIYSLVK